MNLLALYRGTSLNDAQLIAVSTDEEVVAEFAERLLARPELHEGPVVQQLDNGRRAALRAIAEGR